MNMKKTVLIMFACVMSGLTFLTGISENDDKAFAAFSYMLESEFQNTPFFCAPYDVIKCVDGESETYRFANMERILVLSARPATDKEIIEYLSSLKSNDHYCYFEKEKCIVYYNYNTNEVYDTDYKMDAKYTVNFNTKTINAIETDNIVQDLTKQNEYWLIWRENEWIVKQRMILKENSFISPLDNKYSPLGDINNDGTIDISDLSELSLALIGDNSLTTDQVFAADVDVDMIITLSDLARLQQYLSKKIDKL